MAKKQSKRFRKALSGLNGMTVWVHEIDEKAAGDGLSRQHLQDATIVKILDSGIKALGIGNVPEPPGNPWLNIFVNTVKSEDKYFYHITVRLDEIVRPERKRSIKTLGTTWEGLCMGVADRKFIGQVVEKELDEALDHFIYDFLTENS